MTFFVTVKLFVKYKVNQIRENDLIRRKNKRIGTTDNKLALRFCKHVGGFPV